VAPVWKGYPVASSASLGVADARGKAENVQGRRTSRGFDEHAWEVGRALHGCCGGGRQRRRGRGLAPARKGRGSNSPSQVVGLVGPPTPRFWKYSKWLQTLYNI
jgi:hypothetical protein